MTEVTSKPALKKYWVLLIDLMGFARRMASPEQQVETAEIYKQIVGELTGPTMRAAALETFAEWCRSHADSPDTDQETRQDLIETAEHLETRQIPDLTTDSSWGSFVRIFSDSIFVFLEDEPVGNLSVHRIYTCAIASIISSRLWQTGIPHRGALAFGDCFVDKNVFLGLPVVRAHEWEKAQNWLGISVEPSSREAALDFGAFIGKDALVPTKGGRIPTTVVLPWPETHGNIDLSVRGFAGAFEEAQRLGLIQALPKYVETAALWLKLGVRAPPLMAIAKEPGLGLPMKLVP